MSTPPTIEELLARANEAPAGEAMQRLRRRVAELALVFKGRVIYDGEDACTAGFSTTHNAAAFQASVNQRLAQGDYTFRARRNGGEVRVTWK